MKILSFNKSYLKLSIEVLGIKLSIPFHSIKKITSNQKKILKKLHTKYGKEKIKVGFLINELAKWKYQSLYNELAQDDNFEPVILVTELKKHHSSVKNYQNTVEDCYNYFKAKNLNVRYAYDIKNKRYLSTKEFDVDILFYEQPWNIDIKQRPDYASQQMLTCYTSYGMNIINFSIEYMNNFHSLLWTMFIENESLIPHFSQTTNEEIKNCYAVGCPILDEYHHVKIDKNKTKPLIIYAPQHSFEKASLRCATFHHNSKEILELAKKYSDSMNWVFKPHPRLKQALIQNKIMTEKEIED